MAFLGEKLVVKRLNEQIYYIIEVSVRNRTVARPINPYPPFAEQKENHQVCVNRCRIACAQRFFSSCELQAKNYWKRYQYVCYTVRRPWPKAKSNSAQWYKSGGPLRGRCQNAVTTKKCTEIHRTVLFQHNDNNETPNLLPLHFCPSR